MLNLVIADNSNKILKFWSEIFEEINTISTLKSDISTCMSLPSIDAVLMMGMFAHERYGSKPKMGESQVLRTQETSGMPKFVVTTPPFSAYFEHQYKANKQENILSQNERISAEEKTYILFIKVFECIEKFNQINPEMLIQTLAVHLSFLNFPQGQPEAEAKAALRAYRESYLIPASLIS